MKMKMKMKLKIAAILSCCCMLNVGCGMQAYRGNESGEVTRVEPAENSQGSEIDYQVFSGFWSEGGVSHEEILKEGGMEFYVEITDQNELSGWIYAQQWKTERFAEIEDISCRIEEGQCSYPFADDGWGNSGTLRIQLKQDAIEITVEDFLSGDENSSGFGISGSHTLTRRNMTRVSDLEEQSESVETPDRKGQSEPLGQYSADWTEERLNEEIGKRTRYREECSFYGEWMNYMENVREVRDISMYTDPLYAADTIIYSREDFEGVPPLILHLAKNEIYARHGYIFRDTDLYNYFMMMVWYLPCVAPEEFDASVFNETEQHNLDILRELDTY